MNDVEFKVGDMVTWNEVGLTYLDPGVEPIFTVTKIDHKNRIVYVLVPDKGINSTYSSFLKLL